MQLNTLITLLICEFKTAKAFETWLRKNHEQSSGIWLKIFKKDSGIKTITYAQAVDIALCYGWIDSQKKSFDERAYMQRFGPRKTKSIWSKINTTHVERLIEEGRMQTAGLKVVEKAKADGSWANAYDSQSKMTIPEDFLKQLIKDKKAETFFKKLNKTNLYSIAFRLQTAKKQETRDRRIFDIIEMLAKGQKFH
jgi:uncharacterized protein YdeI (YjbR/CyaY-like superfamily)